MRVVGHRPERLFCTAACGTGRTCLRQKPAPIATDTPATCPVTEPEWLLAPDDPAVLSEPAFGYYYVNADRSMWASAWWSQDGALPLQAGEDGVKVGWFRPAGATLTITGQRIDGDAPPLGSHVPCCYPTRFQASGIDFPEPGCWRVAATAADSQLTFVVEVVPQP
ncbi:MAG: hypothetical protein R2844_17265 [Caldilineales bacterium]